MNWITPSQLSARTRPVKTKRCNKCKLEKSLAEFPRIGKVCHDCKGEYQRRQRQIKTGKLTRIK